MSADDLEGLIGPTAVRVTAAFAAKPAAAPSVQDTSAGRIRVAIRPGAAVAAVIASTVSEPTSCAAAVRRTQPDTLWASASMSDSSGASYCLW